MPVYKQKYTVWQLKY